MYSIIITMDIYRQWRCGYTIKLKIAKSLLIRAYFVIHLFPINNAFRALVLAYWIQLVFSKIHTVAHYAGLNRPRLKFARSFTAQWKIPTNLASGKIHVFGFVMVAYMLQLLAYNMRTYEQVGLLYGQSGRHM